MTRPGAKKITVSKRALIQRINRRLAPKGEMVKVARGERARQEVGEYWVLNDRNMVVATFIDLEKWGRETGALNEWERVEK